MGREAPEEKGVEISTLLHISPQLGTCSRSGQALSILGKQADHSGQESVHSCDIAVERSWKNGKNDWCQGSRGFVGRKRK